MAQDKIEISIEAADRFSRTFLQLGSQLQKMRGDLQGAGAGADTAKSAFEKFSLKVIALNQGLQLAGTIFNSTVGAAARMTSTILETADTFRRTEIQLTSLTGSLSEARQSMGFLLNLARETPQSLVTLNRAFVRLKSTGVEDTERAMKALTNAVAAFGGNDQDLELAALAFQQMAGKGVVSMEELRRQLGERIPTAIKILAREMGITLPELFKKVESGALNSNIAIQKLVEGFEKDFAGKAKKAMDTWQAATAKFTESWDLFLRALGDTGLLDAAIKSINSLTDVMRVLTGTMDKFSAQAAKTERLEELKTQIERTEAAIKRSPSDIFSMGMFLENLKEEYQKLLVDALRPANEALGDLEHSFEKARKAAEKLAPALTKAEQAAANLVDEAMIEALNDFADALSDVEFEAQKAAIAARELEVAFAEDALQEALSGAADEIDDVTWSLMMQERQIKKTRERAAEYKKVMESWENTFNTIGKAALNAMGPLGQSINTFTNWLEKGKPPEQAAAIAGAELFLKLLMENEAFRESMDELNEALAELVAPIAEALAPAIHVLADVMLEFMPLFVMLGDAIELVGVALESVKESLNAFPKAIQDMIDSITGQSTGNTIFDPRAWFAGVKFHDGGMLTESNMMPLPGGAPGEGLFVGQVGERVVPRGGATGGGINATFNLKGVESRDFAERIRRVMEEMIVTGQLRAA